jgi:hypothetical protein
MSQFFDQASLVMVPSGYKNGKVYSQKPLSADGELTFTRSNDTATRVGPDGLIEKVRTNLILQSNTFSNAAWNKANVTLTAGQPDKDGGTNAWRVQFTGSSSDSYIYQDITNQLNAGSIYVKGTAVETALIGVRTSVGGGALTTFNGSWQRVTDTNASNGYFVISDYGGSTATDFLIMNAQVEVGDIATDYIATTSAAVSVGPVANLPRLDYSGGATCPKLLLEASATKFGLFSESFDNAAYSSLTAGSATAAIVTANFATSPDGFQNADRLQFSRTGTTSSDLSLLLQNAVILGATGTATIYLKSNTSSTQNILFYWGGGQGIVFAVTPEWQRFTLTNLAAGTDTILIGTRGGSGDFFNGGDLTLDVLAYGLQIEAGAYATSYINTLGAAVTRGEDLSYKTGISSLLNSTNGVLYFEGEIVLAGAATEFTFISVSDGAGPNSVMFRINLTTLQIHAQINNVTKTGITIPVGVAKLAIGWDSSLNYSFYINGVLVDSGTYANLMTAFDRINFAGFNLAYPFIGTINQTLIFPTALTNAQLAELTTI